MSCVSLHLLEKSSTIQNFWWKRLFLSICYYNILSKKNIHFPEIMYTLARVTTLFKHSTKYKVHSLQRELVNSENPVLGAMQEPIPDLSFIIVTHKEIKSNHNLMVKILTSQMFHPYSCIPQIFPFNSFTFISQSCMDFPNFHFISFFSTNIPLNLISFTKISNDA